MFYVQNLTHHAGLRRLFDDLSLHLKKGKITAIFGPSGCGKTTFLKLLAATIQPDAGSISFKNVEMTLLDEAGRIEMRRSLGFLLQSSGLFTQMNVLENIAFPLRFHTDLPEPLIEESALMKAEAVGLQGFELWMPHRLSGGMMKRAALARALALDPDLLILDEPFAGQDPDVVVQLTQLILRINQLMGTTILIVSHDLPETLSIVDEVYLLNQGKMLQQFDHTQLLKNLVHLEQRAEPFSKVMQRPCLVADQQLT